MSKADQMVRVLALAQALSASRRGVAMSTFASEHGWPLRTLHRDIKTLEAAGFPIGDEAGRYQLMEGWTPPGQAGLDRDEAPALFAARRLMGGAGATSLGRALDRLWTKLSGAGDRPARPIRAVYGPPAPVQHSCSFAHSSRAATGIHDCRYQEPLRLNVFWTAAS